MAAALRASEASHGPERAPRRQRRPPRGRKSLKPPEGPPITAAMDSPRPGGASPRPAPPRLPRISAPPADGDAPPPPALSPAEAPDNSPRPPGVLTPDSPLPVSSHGLPARARAARSPPSPALAPASSASDASPQTGGRRKRRLKRPRARSRSRAASSGAAPPAGSDADASGDREGEDEEDDDDDDEEEEEEGDGWPGAEPQLAPTPDIGAIELTLDDEARQALLWAPDGRANDGSNEFRRRRRAHRRAVAAKVRLYTQTQNELVRTARGNRGLLASVLESDNLGMLVVFVLWAAIMLVLLAVLNVGLTWHHLVVPLLSMLAVPFVAVMVMLIYGWVEGSGDDDL